MAYTARYHRHHAPAEQTDWAILDDALAFLADGESGSQLRAEAVLDSDGNVLLEGRDLDRRIGDLIREWDAE